MQYVLSELSVLAWELGRGDTEDYVRTSLVTLMDAVGEDHNPAPAADRLSRSLQLLERQRARGSRRHQQQGKSRLRRMRLLVDDRLRPLTGS